MEKKQTAVQWLIEQTRTPEWKSLKRGDILEQALAKEREQIEDAFEKGVECGDDNGVSFIDIHAQRYYTITFKP